MPNDSTFRPPATFVDPRTLLDYQPEHWPLCNGEEGPAIGTEDLRERRYLEFLAAYYQVNRRLAELEAMRVDREDTLDYQLCLEAVEAALNAVDAMEDRYEPIGLYGDPSMQGVFYRNINFPSPEPPRIFSQPSLFSSHLAIPGLDEIPEKELTGPVIVTHRIHGKVDI